MKMKLYIPLMITSLSIVLCSCVDRDPIHTLNVAKFKDTSGPLKDAATFPIGIATDYTPFLTDETYKQIVAREATNTTFGYHMKHGAIVKDDGSLDFTKADQLYDAATAVGLEVFGHTLGWHANQNANYLKTAAGILVQSPTNLLTNGNFETGTGTSGSVFPGWNIYNSSGQAQNTVFFAGSGSNEVRGGSRSVKIINPVDHPGQQYQVQFVSDLFNTTPGKQYTASFWIKSSSAGGSVRLSTTPNASYQGDQTTNTTYTQISWNFTVSNLTQTQTRIAIDIGLKANTYFIDDFTVTELIPVITPTQIVAKLDVALEKFVTGMVTHYKDKVKAWDVINEILANNGAIRNNDNTTAGNDILVWSHYMGKSFGVKAFQYAQAADPNALLFINDYALESSSAKTDSLVAYVNYLKSKGAKVDGIGTQMHIATNTSYGGIDVMFQKLAATGLLVRVSELDVRANPYDKSNFDISTEVNASSNQAVMYKYVIDSYVRNVPAAQRHGITIWGVSDKDSWILINQNKVDAPLLFDNNYEKKPAYAGVLAGLKGK